MIKLYGTLLLLALFTAVPLLSQKPEQKSEDQTPSAELIAKGKYLVDDVGQCADCHSPRNEEGEYVREKWLRGAPIFFKPTVPVPVWAEFAPPIAGLPGWTDEQAIRFLTTGETPAGGPARIPMPAFRFNREDAVAVAAYLRSLGTQSAEVQHSGAKQP